MLLIVLIDPEGHARDVRVHRTSGFEQLDVAARDAVWAALFKPHRENGVARSARVIVPIQFSLTVRTASASYLQIRLKRQLTAAKLRAPQIPA